MDELCLLQAEVRDCLRACRGIYRDAEAAMSSDGRLFAVAERVDVRRVVLVKYLREDEAKFFVIGSLCLRSSPDSAILELEAIFLCLREGVACQRIHPI